MKINLSTLRSQLKKYGNIWGLDVSVAKITNRWGYVHYECGIWNNGNMLLRADIFNVDEGKDWIDRILSGFNPDGY